MVIFRGNIINTKFIIWDFTPSNYILISNIFLKFLFKFKNKFTSYIFFFFLYISLNEKFINKTFVNRKFVKIDYE